MDRINQSFQGECLCAGDVKTCAYGISAMDGKCMYYGKDDKAYCSGLAKRAFQDHLDAGYKMRKETQEVVR